MKPSREDVIGMIVPLMRVVGNIDRVRKQGPAATLATMNVIASQGQVRPLDIANVLGVHQSTVTRQVKSLERDGMVSVIADQEDGRSCRISLTAHGEEELRRLTDFGISRFELMVGDWSKEEVETLGKLLAKLEKSGERLRALNPPPTTRSWKDGGRA